MINTIDQKEIEQFSALSNKWWDKSGPFSALHKMSRARIEFILRNSKRVSSKNNSEGNILKGLKCLDIGCGGGILSEPLCRLGAKVTGIDASDMAIKSAILHSQKSRLQIDFKCMDTAALIKSENLNLNNQFDIVIASEVIEHVNNRDLFLSDISKLSKPGGLVVLTTINQSVLGVLLGKFFAEDVLSILPKGTHDPKKFISPNQLIEEAAKHKIILDDKTGFIPTFKMHDLINKEFGEFKLSRNIQVNYGLAGINIK
jgi:2-polyprenyl-6-hydroxyphenyl methylase/3-demethylubiquinone-9 3-methyltransferase